MKILGYSLITGTQQLIMKSDSSLLTNRKPFFLPEQANEISMTPCQVLRICRLGKGIQPCFASRYYDAVAPGINFCHISALKRGAIAEAYAFDYALAVGQWLDPEHPYFQSEPTLLTSRDQAIADISRVITIRQGDLIFIDYTAPAQILNKENVIQIQYLEQELLYCKIK